MNGVKEEFITELFIEAKENELLGEQLGVKTPEQEMRWCDKMPNFVIYGSQKVIIDFPELPNKKQT